MTMWKLLRGEVEFKLFVDYILKTEDGFYSAFDIGEPESYPCLAKPVYIGPKVYDVVFVYKEDASVLLKVFENGGML